MACSSPATTGSGGGTGGSGGSGGAGGGASEDPVEAGCKALAKAHCDFHFGCPGTITSGESLPFATLADCYAGFDPDCVKRHSRPGAKYARADLEACAAVVTARPCSRDVLHWGACPPPASKGTKANGANCAESAECSSGACTRATSTVCGTCVDSAAVGKSCLAGTDCASAADNLVCVSMACATELGVGATCGAADGFCKLGLQCDNTCKELNSLPGAGALCAAGGDACKPGHGCSGGTCLAFTAFAAGENCFDTSLMPYKHCAPGSVCAYPTDGGSLAAGECQPAIYVAEGAPCNQLQNRTVCGPGLTCAGANPACEKVKAPLVCN